MLERYLCPKHREWLTMNPSAALACWNKSIETGLQYYRRKALPQARSYCGCGLETAEIMLLKGEGCHRDAVDRYMASLLLYAGVCRDSGYSSLLGELTNRGRQILRRSWGKALIPTYLFHANCQLRKIIENPAWIDNLLTTVSPAYQA